MTSVQTTLQVGFEDFDKNKPFFTLKGNMDELLLIAKLASHIRIGTGSRGSIAAHNIIQAIEDGCDMDFYEDANMIFDFSVSVDSQFGGTAVTVNGDDVVLEFSDVQP